MVVRTLCGASSGVFALIKLMAPVSLLPMDVAVENDTNDGTQSNKLKDHRWVVLRSARAHFFAWSIFWDGLRACVPPVQFALFENICAWCHLVLIMFLFHNMCVCFFRVPIKLMTPASHLSMEMAAAFASPAWSVGEHWSVVCSRAYLLLFHDAHVCCSGCLLLVTQIIMLCGASGDSSALIILKLMAPAFDMSMGASAHGLDLDSIIVLRFCLPLRDPCALSWLE